jgi:catechol 2,3-dioxygenase-like lactoylglutathione lyase family enzyme
MPISKGFNHVATLTTDCDRHAEFYRAAFGAEVTFTMEKKDDHPRMFVLDLGGGSALNVFEVSEEDIIGERRKQGGRGAIDHFAIVVPTRADLEAMPQRIVDAGGEVGEIQRLGDIWSLFFRDVDGMELEVVTPITS